MSTAPNEPAAPLNELDQSTGHIVAQHLGLTAREHAAIALRVPDSGTDWLDAMIRTAKRDDVAARAMLTMISMCQYADGEWDHDTVAQNAYALADAMLAGAATQSTEGE